MGSPPVGLEFDVERRDRPAKGPVAAIVITLVVSLIAFLILAAADDGTGSTPLPTSHVPLAQPLP